MDVRRTRWALLGGLALLSVGCLAYTIGAGTGFWKEHSSSGDWLYIGLVIGAALLCFCRAALVRAQRPAWVAIGTGVLLGGLGDLYWLLSLNQLENPPYPSPADALWLFAYAPTGLGLWLLLARRDTPFDGGRSAWVDGVVAALAGTALAAATLLAAPLDGVLEGHLAVFATNLSYPLSDLFLLAVVLVVCGRSGWRPGLVGGLLAGSLVVRALTDFVYLDQVTRDTYVLNGLLDAGWVIAPTLAAAAGCLFVAERQRPGGWRIYVALLASTSVALALLIYDHFDRLSALAFVLASTALAVGVVRAALSVRTVLSTSQHEALTDLLTGLSNRRALSRDLDDALAAAIAGRSMTVATFDLNGFKRYNDTFGHPAGDALLQRLGARLSAAVAGVGSAYRVGGDEFCILLNPGHEHMVEAAVTALSEVGEGFTVKTAHGAITIPDDAEEVETALKLVDQRLYTNKLSRDAGTDTVEALLRTLHESEPEIEAHLGNVASLARAVAREMELQGEEIDVLTRAAQLHDIGKLAIPDAILHKPAPPHRGRVGVHALAHIDRGAHSGLGGPPRARGAHRALEPRALGRRRVSRRPGRRGDPPRRPHRVRLRRI